MEKMRKVIFIALIILVLPYVGCLNNRTIAPLQPDLPIVVWWYPRLFPHFDTAGNNIDTEIISVDAGSCIITRQKQAKDDPRAAAFIFYGTDFKASDVPLPRNNKHVWALIHEESPMNNYMFSHGAGIKLFNLTATFSRHSDYPLTSQFIEDFEYLLRDPLPLAEKNRLMREEGLAPVLYLQSHCGVASDRDRYIKKLMEYIDIDSYGKCLNNKELPRHLTSTTTFSDEDLLNFIKKYKFHIAFENALCKDYMTEKLFRALHVGSVPIYFGSSLAKDWMPTNSSMIDAQDYQSPEELAQYIRSVNSDDVSYLKFMDFKTYSTWTNHMLINELKTRKWFVNKPGEMDFLQGFERFVCEEALRTFTLNSSERSAGVASSSHMGCPQPHPSLDVQVGEDDEWRYYQWEEQYWNGLDDALALRDMILAGERSAKKHSKYLRHRV